MRAPLAAILPALLLAATPGLAQLVPDPSKPPPAGAPTRPPASRAQASTPDGKPPPLYDMPDPAPRRPGPPSRPGPEPRPDSRAQPTPPNGPPTGPDGKPPPLAPGDAPPPRSREVSSGTGFVVGDRQALTNDHVVRDCRQVRARTPEGRDITATVRSRDSRRDLAILDLREAAGPPLAFRAEPAIRRGEAVVTYGFPLAGMLSSGPTLTTGDISALAGLADNRAHYQISAPVQPGNSGGPLLDLAGNVVGIITSKLNAQRVAQRTGDIPQNVNFAVKSEEALAFLRENNIRPRTAPSTTSRTAAEVGEAIHPSVLFLRCLN
ncbi:Trypsin-like peptidase domain-containing protein [Roseomonas rosea]|uniref:Trypsin-like peptidase domain-containing protein n=1 Tax=Muricoccus roseus TaxID=198092 RepID=A0A1M6Q7G3_9PROT|nr:serine protease [Roseomonas rosea]SHK16033.1 Trypsin-like peptidase domain-containing protein [Roseomonas rosea]